MQEVEWEDNAILENELTTQDEEVKIPPCFEVIEEVTENEKYRNYSIAKGLV